MDLGTGGRTALVTGASQGLGRAAAFALAEENVDLTVVARRPDVLEGTASEIRIRTGASVTAVPADIATADGRARVFDACPEPDILINNTGGGPMGDFRGFSHDEWLRVIDAVMLAPIEMIKATIDSMIEKRFGRVINITTMGMRVPTPCINSATVPAVVSPSSSRRSPASTVSTMSRSTTCCRDHSSATG